MAVTQTMSFSATPPALGVDTKEVFSQKAEACWAELKDNVVPDLNTAFGQINSTETNINNKEATVTAKAAEALASANSAAQSAIAAEAAVASLPDGTLNDVIITSTNTYSAAKIESLIGGVETTLITTPTITTPTNGAVNFIGEIITTYTTSASYAGVQDWVRWEAGNSDFSVIYDSYEGASNLLSWTPAVGLALTVVYVRVKQGSDGHRSSYSPTISFTTPNTYVETPTLTVTGTPTDVPKTPTLTTSAFSVNGGTDTHASTDWQVVRVSDSVVVWESLANSANKLSIAVPAGNLVVSTAYTFRARHNGTTYGSSAWVEVAGTTKSAFSVPFGVQWNPTTDLYTRTGASVGTAVSTSYAGNIQSLMRRCVLNANGTVNYYLSATNSAFREDGVTPSDLTGASGNVMVQIPKFYYKYENVAGVHDWSVSLEPEAGYTVHPAFIKAGVEVAYRYYPAYEGYNNAGTLQSRSGVLPTASQTIATFRTYAQANGTGWSLIDWNTLYAVQLLFLTEYADFDTQAMIGNGNDLGDDFAITTGQSNGIGNASSPSTNDNMWMSYRGIENWYASMYKFIDGVNIQNRVYYVNNNPATYASDVFTGDYVVIGVTSAAANGYVSNIVASNRGFVASAVAGSSTTLIPDYFYQNVGNKIMLFGGSANGALYCGGFFLYTDGESSASGTNIGSGVCF